MARVLLLLPTSTYRATDFIDAAQTLGAEVVVGSNEEQALADAMGARALELDFDDPQVAAEAIVENCQRMAVDAVVAVDDQGVLTAALAAERLGLKHNSPESVALTRDKAGMREALSNSAVKQPEFELARGAAEAVAAAERIGFPCVLKPVSLSASRGVIRVDDAGAAQDAARRIVAILDESEADDEQRILVESYIPGIEVAVEGLLRGGRLEVLAIFDKPDPLEGPYFEETIYTTPSRHSRQDQDAIVEATEQAVEELGLTEGPIHAEARFNGSGVWIAGAGGAVDRRAVRQNAAVRSGSEPGGADIAPCAGAAGYGPEAVGGGGGDDAADPACRLSARGERSGGRGERFRDNRRGHHDTHWPGGASAARGRPVPGVHVRERRIRRTRWRRR